MRMGFFVQRFLSGGKPLYIQRFTQKIPRFRRTGLPFTPVETCQKIGGLPWKPISYGDSNENLKTCKLRGLQWKSEKEGPQFFWYVATEVNGSPTRRNLGTFSANLCMYKDLPHWETFVQRTPFSWTGLCHESTTFSLQEPFISLNNWHVLWKEPYIPAKEPYILSKEPPFIHRCPQRHGHIIERARYFP